MECEFKDDCEYYYEYQNTCSHDGLKENGVHYCGKYRKFKNE